MSRRPFSEKAANQFLHKTFHAPPGDATAAMLATDWQAAVESHFVFSPDQRSVLEAIDPAGNEVIQSTLATALAHRKTNPRAGMEVHFTEAPATQTRPVEVRVERETRQGDGARPSDGSNELTVEEIGFWIVFIATIIKVECT